MKSDNTLHHYSGGSVVPQQYLHNPLKTQLNLQQNYPLGNSVVDGEQAPINIANAKDNQTVEKPTHRRKKSQQPTLMTTKQKQYTGNTVVPRASYQIEAEGNLIGGPLGEVTLLADMHPHELLYQNPQLNRASFAQAENSRQQNSGSKRNSNLKERQPVVALEQRFSIESTGAVNQDKTTRSSIEVKGFQPMSPKSNQPFAALSHIRDRVHSLGMVDNNSQQPQLENVPIIVRASAVAPKSQALITSDKKSKAKKLTGVPERTQLHGSRVIGAMPTTHMQPLHKRNQTKTHYPMTSLLGQQSLSFGSKGSNIGSDMSSKVHLASRIGGSLGHLESQSARHPDQLKNTSQNTVVLLSKQTNSQESMIPSASQTSSIIKQLMKKHLTTNSTIGGVPKVGEDAKAAYLRHAANSNSLERTGAIHQSPPAAAVLSDSPSRLSSKVQSQPKRVTFEPQQEYSSDNIREETEEESYHDQQMISYVREEDNSLDDAEAEMIVEELKHERGGHSRKASKHYSYVNPDHLMDDDEMIPESQIIHESQNDDVSRPYTDESNEDAPTVVIETSADEQECARQFRNINDSQDFEGGHPANTSGGVRESNYKSNNPSCLVLDNIQAALQSIRKQEQEEEFVRSSIHQNGDRVKKAVTIMTIEEEDALITQINEIRERIKRGETAAQQQERYAENSDLSQQQVKRTIDYEDACQEDASSHILYTHEQQDTFNEYGGRGSLQPPPSMYIGGPHHHGMITKPPLYSLTFAHPDLDPQQLGNEQIAYQHLDNHQVVHIKQRSFHSIDNNAPPQLVNCLIVTDGPNIYEKKRQRFERIQRMRNNTQGPVVANAYGTLNGVPEADAISSNYQPSRDGNTPIAGGSSSCISGNYASLVKKQQQQHDSKKKAVSKTKKSTSQKAKSFSSKSVQKQVAISSIRRTTGVTTASAVGTATGKSRQNSTVDQIAHSITTQSQYHLYHSSSKSHQNQVLNAAAAFIKPTTNQFLRKDQVYSHRHHLTLDPDTHHGSYGLPNETANTYRGASTKFDDNEEMQIQLFSLKKIIPQDKINRSSAHRPQATSQALIKKKLPTKQRKGTSIHVSSSSQLKNIGTSIAVINPPTKVFHVKNNKSNLVINVPETSLAQSLSLKRLKTPKLKFKEELYTPPIERNAVQANKIQTFHSVPGFKQVVVMQTPSSLPGYPVFPSSSVKNQQQQQALNYQTTVQQSTTAYKSPFIYPQTSKASSSAVRQQDTTLKVMDSSKVQRGASSSSHVKQKSLHIAPSSQPLTKVMSSKPLTLDSVSKLMSTKRETDSAFDLMKRKLSETAAPHLIQPTKFISTANSGTTSANQLIPMSDGMMEHELSIEDFEKNYKKLSGMLDKLFTL